MLSFVGPVIHLQFPGTLLGLLVWLVGLVILWIIISIPVYFAGKAFTKGKSGLGNAMGATLGGGLAYFIVFVLVSLFLGAVIGDSATAFAIVLALLVWLAVYRAAFDTTWIKAVGIVILSWIILVVLDFILIHTLGVSFPDFFPFV